LLSTRSLQFFKLPSLLAVPCFADLSDRKCLSIAFAEVYPDNPRAASAKCNDVRVAAARAAIDYALAHGR